MEKVNHNEFKKICNYLHHCDIVALRLVNKRFYMLTKKYIKPKYMKLKHNCNLLQDNFDRVRRGCIKLQNIEYHEDLIIHAASLGYLDVCKIIEQDNHDACKDGATYAFKTAFAQGHLPVCKWLNVKFIIDVTNIRNNYIDNAVQEGHFNACKWLVLTFGKKINWDNNRMFCTIISIGDVDFCKLVLKDFDIDIVSNIENILRNAVFSGNVKMCKWISSVCESYGIDVSNELSRENFKYFRYLAKESKIEVCKWLISKLKIPDYIVQEYALELFS